MKDLELYIKHTLANGTRPDLDSVLSRTLDPKMIVAVAKDFHMSFEHEEITLVLTAESNGVALAYETAKAFGIRALYAKKREEPEAYVATVNSKTNTTLYLPKRFLTKKEKVLIVDDCIGKGGIASALVEIVRQSGAELVGLAVGIERAYLGASEQLRNRGIRVRAACSIKSDDGALGIEIAPQGKRRTK